MMGRTKALVLLSVMSASVGLPGSVAGQQELSESPAELLGARPGQHLRLRLQDGRTLHGQLEEVRKDSLLFSDEPRGPLAGAWVPLSSVRTVEVRGRATRKGAVILGVSGAVAGGLLGALAHELCESGCESRGQTILSLGAFGGLAGAVLGALVGAAIPTYRSIWP